MTQAERQWCLDRLSDLKDNVSNNLSAVGALTAIEALIAKETPVETQTDEPAA